MKRRDLYAIYKKGLTEGRFNSMREAGRWLCTQPAPCFYVSPEYASILVGKMLTNQPLDDIHPAQRRLARRLYQDYLEYQRYHPDNRRSRIEIMNDLVHRPAPEFYMSPDAIRRALRIEIENVQRQMGWRD